MKGKANIAQSLRETHKTHGKKKTLLKFFVSFVCFVGKNSGIGITGNLGYLDKTFA